MSRNEASRAKQVASAESMFLFFSVIVGILKFRGFKNQTFNITPHENKEIWLSFVFNYFLMLPIVEPLITVLDFPHL